MNVKPDPAVDTFAGETTQVHDRNADLQAVEEIATARRQIAREIEKRIIGQTAVIDHLLTALFARGHCLFVGVPGLAKTMLISTLAETLNLSFQRIQFTPDLMPSDITGTEVLEEDHSTGRRFFRFLRGPIFANLILADEINRTPPKTQAALLQSMQEYRVTAGGQTYELGLPFLVFATQNPIEQEGTYPLPEAQLDRFLLAIRITYPGLEDEISILRATTGREAAAPESVVGAAQVLALQGMVRDVMVSEPLLRYVAELVRATRPGEGHLPARIRKYVRWGAGPRAGQALVLGAKAWALLHGRVAVSPADVRRVALPVLRHRILPNFAAEAEGISAEDLVADVLAEVHPPQSDIRI